MPWCPVLLNKHTVKCERAVSIKPKINHSARTSTDKREGQAKVGWSNKWWEELVGRRRGGADFGRFEGGEVERAGLAWIWRSCGVYKLNSNPTFDFLCSNTIEKDKPSHQRMNQRMNQNISKRRIEYPKDQPHTCGWKPLRRWRT